MTSSCIRPESLYEGDFTPFELVVIILTDTGNRYMFSLERARAAGAAHRAQYRVDPPGKNYFLIVYPNETGQLDLRVLLVFGGDGLNHCPCNLCECSMKIVTAGIVVRLMVDTGKRYHPLPRNRKREDQKVGVVDILSGSQWYGP